MGIKFNPLIFSGFDLTGSSGSGAVSSVNGQTGVVVLDADDVGAANQSLSNLTPTAINQSLEFDADAVYNIGSPSEQVNTVNAVSVQGTNNLDLYANNGSLTFGAPGGEDINLTKISGTGALRMRFYDDAGSFYSGIKAASDLSTAGSSTLTLPEGAGSAGQVLSTDGTGILSWVAGVPALTLGSIPFSDGVTLIEDNAHLFWDNTTKRLLIGDNQNALSGDIQGKIRLINKKTDPSDGNATEAGTVNYVEMTYTDDTAMAVIANYSLAKLNIAAGKSNTNALAGTFSTVSRADAGDDGSLAFSASYVGSITQGGSATKTTDLYAAYLTGFHSIDSNANQITDMYDFLALPGTIDAAAVTNRYGIVIQPDAGYTKTNWLSGVVQIGGSSLSIDAAASLDLQSNDTALLLNRLDDTAEGAIGVNGMIIYNTDQNKFRGYENGAWSDFIGAAADLSNLVATSINQNLEPDSDDTRNLGSSGSRWQTVHASVFRNSGGGITLNTPVNSFVDITNDGVGTGAVSLRLYDDDAAEFVAFKAPASVPTSYTLTLPTADGTAGQVLQTDGAGQLSFSSSALQMFTAAGDPGSPVAGQVYFNTTLNKLKVYSGTAWETITSV